MGPAFYPSHLSGAVPAPTSKSMAQRYIILSALSDAPAQIVTGEISDDVRAVIGGMRALGAAITENNGVVVVCPVENAPVRAEIDCGESGACLRFLLPVSAALGVNARFAGRGRLPDRPIAELISAMEAHGVTFSSHALPFEISRRLSGGAFTLPGDISSQFVSGLLLSLPLVGGGIELTTPLHSAPYVAMTVSALKKFGVRADGLSIPRKKPTSPGTVVCDGDWSAAAVWLCAGALSGEATVTDIDISSPQSDRAIVDILRTFGASVDISCSAVTVRSAPLRGCTLDMTDMPDLVPLVSVVAAAADGETVINGVLRLRYKESDRLSAIADILGSLGVSAKTDGSSLIIRGGGLHGGSVDIRNDHRLVFAAAAASCAADKPIYVSGVGAALKSYPRFLRDFISLGGDFREY